MILSTLRQAHDTAFRVAVRVTTHLLPPDLTIRRWANQVNLTAFGARGLLESYFSMRRGLDLAIQVEQGVVTLGRK